MQKGNYTKRLRARRVEQDGISFDSLAERDFYFELRKTFTGAKIIRPCELRLPGKVRSWKCDYAIVATSPVQAGSLGSLCRLLNGNTEEQSNSTSSNKNLSKEVVYVEFKGQTDLSTGLALIDKNFKARIDWLNSYADYILDSLCVVGSGTGGVLSYCTKNKFRVIPIHSTEFFLEQGKELWSAH